MEEEEAFSKEGNMDSKDGKDVEDVEDLVSTTAEQ